MGIRAVVSVLLLTITLGIFQHCGVFRAIQGQVESNSIRSDDDEPPSVTIDTNPIILLTTVTTFNVSGTCDLKEFTTGYRFEATYRPSGIAQTRSQLFNAFCLDGKYSLTITLTALGITANVPGILGVKIVVPRATGDIVGNEARTNIQWTCQLSCNPMRACGSREDSCGGNTCEPQTAAPPCPVCPAVRTCTDPTTFCGTPNPADTAGCNPTACPRGTNCPPQCDPERTCTDPRTFCGSPSPPDTGGCHPTACPRGTDCPQECDPVRTCTDPSTFCGDPTPPNTGGCNPTACPRGNRCGQACDVQGLPRGATSAMVNSLSECATFATGRAGAFCQGGYTCAELFYPGGTMDLTWQFAGGGAGRQDYGCQEEARDAPCAPQFLCRVTGLPRGTETKMTTSMAACKAFAGSRAAGFCQGGFTCSELPPGELFHVYWTWNGQSDNHTNYGCDEPRIGAPCTGLQACTIRNLPRGDIVRYTTSYDACRDAAGNAAAHFCQNGYYCSELSYPDVTFPLAWAWAGGGSSNQDYGCRERPINYPCNDAQTCTVNGIPGRQPPTSSLFSLSECHDFARTQAEGFCQSGNLRCEDLKPGETFNLTWTWGGQTRRHDYYGCAEERVNEPCKSRCTVDGIGIPPGIRQTTQVDTDEECRLFAGSRAGAFCQSGQLSCTEFPPGASFNATWSREDGGSGVISNYECGEERTNPPCAAGTQTCSVSGVPGGAPPTEVQSLGECETYAESRAAGFCQSGNLSCITFPPGRTFNLEWEWKGQRRNHDNYGCGEERTNPRCEDVTHTCNYSADEGGSGSEQTASFQACRDLAIGAAARYCQSGQLSCVDFPPGSVMNVEWSWNGQNDHHDNYGCGEERTNPPCGTTTTGGTDTGGTDTGGTDTGGTDTGGTDTGGTDTGGTDTGGGDSGGDSGYTGETQVP